MENSNEFILTMRKDLRKWCHENYHLFVRGNGIEDEPSVHFDFEGKIQERPNDSTVILDLFNAAVGNEIYDPAKKIPSIFPPQNFTTSMHQDISHFLPTSIRHLSFAMKFLVSQSNHVPQHIHGITQN